MYSISGLFKALKALQLPHSFSGTDRLFRAHGHTLAEIHALRTKPGTDIFPRIPDVVVWPRKSLLSSSKYNCFDYSWAFYV